MSMKAPETSSTSRVHAQGVLVNTQFSPKIAIATTNAPATNVSAAEAGGFCTACVGGMGISFCFVSFVSLSRRTREASCWGLESVTGSG